MKELNTNKTKNGTLQFQIKFPPLINFLDFLPDPSFLFGPPHLIIFQIFFADISEIVKTDCSICGTVLISYQF